LSLVSSNLSIMKRVVILIAAFLAVALQSCVYVAPDPTPGPPGRLGRAFFGVSYDNYMPYSYWDNNPSIPYNPTLGSYYPTATGLYEFEYYVNPHEYWYGTYQIFINPGGPGGPHGQPGYDGLDTYLMLICNPWGFYEERSNARLMPSDNGEELVVEVKEKDQHFIIKMKKTTVHERPTEHEPKFKAQ
jgi:hypothetical protein